MSPFFHGHAHVPPGFRFHPTDEELVGYYLYKKLSSETMDMDIIQEIDLYKMEPWDMIDKYTSSSEQLEWYFFSHKDKKYPTGTRTNRATTAGFWKATGRDKAIHTKFKLIGMRKTLVFYKGRAPNGQKTDWIMHEYRLEDEHSNGFGSEDGWVVCRMFKKRAPQRSCGGQPSASYSYDEQVNEMNTNLNDLNNTSHSNMSADMHNTSLANMFTYRNEASGSRQEPAADEHRAFQDAFGQLPHLESYE